LLDGNGKKKTIWKNFLRWGLLVLGLGLGAGGVWSFCVESNRNYGQLATSLITISGVVLTLWMAHERAIEQQEKEDERHNARLESESTRHDERLRAESEREHKRLTAEDDRHHKRLVTEAKMHDERLRAESEREHKRLIAEAQKDRAQRSITQRIDLAEKLAAAIGHLYDENELKQAAGVQEILFQIDDWHALIKSEIAGIEGDKAKKDALEQEGLRHRQELFDIAYKFDTENMHVLKSRARGLKQRLREEGPYSLIELDFSGMVIGCSIPVVEGDAYLDLRGIFANGFVMSNAKMSHVDLSDAYLELVVLDSANLESAKLYKANLESAKLYKANLKSAKLDWANLKSAKLDWANLKSAELYGANLESAELNRANLKSAKLNGANLESAELYGANLESAELNGANLESAELNDANLKSAKLNGANLKSAKLNGANLKSAELVWANLESAELNDANLESAKLNDANLKSADVKDADFKYSDLSFAKINDANGWEDTNILSCANVEGSDIEIIADVGTVHLESSSDERED